MITPLKDAWSCERIFWELLPGVRKYIAIRLKEKGYTLSEIGKILGVSKSAVSQYIGGKRGGELADWMKEVIDRKLDEGCADIMEIIYAIVKHPSFRRGWRC